MMKKKTDRIQLRLTIGTIMGNTRNRTKRSAERVRRQRKRRNTLRIITLLLALCVVLGGIGLGIAAKKAPEASSDLVRKEPEIQETTITIGSTGDIMLHSPSYKPSEYKVDGDYDFSPIFAFMSDIYSAPDYMVANLETTLPGKEAGYSGYPLFKSPDSIATTLTGSGIDLLLLANNHIYDSGKNGFLRTSQFLADSGIDYTGAAHSDEEKKYLIKDINGIKVGFVNYTYETPASGDVKAINANYMDSSVAPYLNSFDPNDRESFYTEFAVILENMRQDGAEFIIFYPHWGNEYQLSACDWQMEMAQRLCNMGVDAIIGSHPHVIQNVDVLTSEDGSHKMFCAYSVGNQLSNQRRQLMNLSTGHTEDGLVIQLEITKNKKGKVNLTGAEYIPTWVYKSSAGLYYILPLNDISNLESVTGLSGIASQAQQSYDRTYATIGEGVQKAIDAYGFQ